MSKSRVFSFDGPNGTKHNFNVPIFVAGSVPPGGYVVCDCGHRHSVFQDRLEHGVYLGEIKPKDAPYDPSRTYRYHYSFIDEEVHEAFPPSKL